LHNAHLHVDDFNKLDVILILTFTDIHIRQACSFSVSPVYKNM